MFVDLFRHIKEFLRKVWMEGMSSEEYGNYLRRRGIHVGENVHFRAPGSYEVDLTRPFLITIGNNVDINRGLTLSTHDFGTFVFRNLYHDFVNSGGVISIGNNVVIGPNVTIMKNVTIGDNCIIGMGSIVTKPIPSNSVAVGIPARVVCSIDEYYKRRKKESIEEAIVIGRELFKIKGNLAIDDLREEWCTFLSKEEYDCHPELKEIVDHRLKDYLNEFLLKEKSFNSFDEYKKAVISSYRDNS